jgi:cytochrome c
MLNLALKYLLIASVFTFVANSAHATAQLALDKGCYSCHGSPPKKNAPTFEKLALDYAKYKNVPSADAELAGKLREGHMFGGIQAHERLSEENALLLIQWIIQGAR